MTCTNKRLIRQHPSSLSQSNIAMFNSISHIKDSPLIRPISSVYMTGLNGKAVEAAIRNFPVQESIYCTIIICGLLWINEEFHSGIKETWEGGLMDGHGDTDRS